mmetsp:Transcript_48762/g.109749  ORF Transcript_48762/g.109749 Transcript_48762/m.109749 type:complete len:80 (-) Transcript_48762:534-773(-)
MMHYIYMNIGCSPPTATTVAMITPSDARTTGSTLSAAKVDAATAMATGSPPGRNGAYACTAIGTGSEAGVEFSGSTTSF